MEHRMNLNPSPFAMIRDGVKTIELRLYDEKRRKIAVGDTIRFCNTDAPSETVSVKVEELYVFDSFEELYANLPLLECGYTEDDIDTASPKDMEAYYSPDMQQRCGVVGIRISVI